MKPTRCFLLLVFTLFASCSEDEPIRSLTLRPVKMTEVDSGRELIYDGNDRLVKVILTSMMPSNEIIQNVNQFYYGDDSILDSCVTDTGYKTIYKYAESRIVETEEFLFNTFTTLYTFKYSENGRRITELASWQRNEEGMLAVHSKSDFEYDENYNLIKSQLFDKNLASGQLELVTTFLFSDYDDQNSSDDLFDAMPFHPYISFRKNNPRELKISNNDGVLSSVERYSYEYNSLKYAVKRHTEVTFIHNGSSGSYETEYFFKEK